MANLSLIKALSKERKITLKSLSEQVGITEQGMQKILKDNTTSIVTLERIAQVLSVSPAVFFDDNSSPTHASRSSVIPQATANGDGAIAIAGDGNVTIPKQILDILAEKDRQLAEKDDIIKHYIMRR